MLRCETVSQWDVEIALLDLGIGNQDQLNLHILRGS